MLLVIIAVVLIWSFLLASHQKNKYNCWEWWILNDDLVCICDSKHWYKEVDWKCKKSEFYEIADAVRDYANERTSISLWYIYWVDMEKINDNEGLLLFVDTSVPWWSNPKEIDAIYWDFASCYEEVEGITSAVWQWYIVAFEKDGEKWIINDFYEIPWFETYKYSNSLQFSYPYLNLKQNNYTYYWWEKPTSDEDELLLEPSHVLNLRDLDWDWKSLEFLIINHFDLMCGINNYLALWYNPNTKKIVTYRFLDPQNHLHARTVLDSDAQNRFQWWILKMHDYGWHGVECDESREYIFNKDNNTFEAKNYKANKKCPY